MSSARMEVVMASAANPAAHRVVSRAEWLRERAAFLALEKAFSRQRVELARRGMLAHLRQRDVSFVAVSRAPLPKLLAFRERMGWSFDWVSCGAGDFNHDFQASFTPAELASGEVYYNYAAAPAGPADREGISVFCRDGDGAVFHTYSCYARGIDMMNGTYQFLDLVPRGRDEQPGQAQDWVRYHDRY
jgi:predicted dithiol-disulfide oxidoreductase (DUF899 family)